MGKKRKTQEAVVKKKALTEFTCPCCKTASSVHVKMQKDITPLKQKAICTCNQCGNTFPIKNLSMFATPKNAYMMWV